MVKGPLKGPGSTWRSFGREANSWWMMELPLGFRVSGCFGTKHPIKRYLEVSRSWGYHVVVSEYEGGLLRSPPEWRVYTHGCALSLGCVPTRLPELVRIILNVIWLEIPSWHPQILAPHRGSHQIILTNPSSWPLKIEIVGWDVIEAPLRPLKIPTITPLKGGNSDLQKWAWEPPTNIGPFGRFY